MTTALNEIDSTMLLADAPCEDSTANLIPNQAREETIRLRAYYIYLDRGSENGSDVDDWLRAEIECFGSV